jgi:DNA adenine methylase
MKKINWIAYYGGKQYMIDWMCNFLPANAKKLHLVDVFGGSGTVSLSLQDLFGTVTYNDIDGELVNLFRVLREYPNELQRVLELTPFSREEHYQSMEGSKPVFEKFREETGRQILKHSLPDTEPQRSIEMARRYFINTQMGFSNKKNGSWSYQISPAKDQIKTVKGFNGKVAKIQEISNRFKKMQIECRTFQDILKFYDSEATFFYCDPPYYHDTRLCKQSYQYEMNHAQHVQLLETLTQCKAKVMLSGYDCELYRTYLGQWNKVEKEFVKFAMQKVGVKIEKRSKGTECLWYNYDLNGEGNKLFNTNERI